MIEEYYNAGYSLIPLIKNSKQPLQKNWTALGRQPIEEIKNFVNANYGLPLGLNGLVIIDIDTHNPDNPQEGFQSLAKMETTYDKLPETFTVESPSGGQHLYFKMPKEFKECHFDKSVQMFPQIDFLTGGKMNVVPPSTIDGNAYKVVAGNINNIPEAPDWLMNIYKKVYKTKASPTQTTAVGHALNAFLEDHSEDATAFLTKWCRTFIESGMNRDTAKWWLTALQCNACPDSEISASEVYKTVDTVLTLEYNITYLGQFFEDVLIDIDMGGRNENMARWAGRIISTSCKPESALWFFKSINQLSVHPPLPNDELMTIFNSIQKSEARRKQAMKEGK